MSFKKGLLYPCAPVTTRGEPTKLSSSKDKIVYTNGRTVIVRDLKDVASCIAYSGHVHNATAARISPTGFYCASGDASGNVRIWDLVGEEQTLKAEYKVLAGRIKDLEWDGESKRIIAVGDGRDKFGHAFMMDSGSSTGDIIGHSKIINAVSIRQQRPYRAATASDDTTIVFHQGVPFKLDKPIKNHAKFVQDVRFSPSGDVFASVGSDSKVFLYDGKTGDVVAELTDSPHTGSIMACGWSPDSKSLVTSSADCTVKLWDIDAKKVKTTWSLGPGVSNQQVGNTWTPGDDIVSLSMSGDLNLFDARAASAAPTRVLHAPQKAVTAGLRAPGGSATFVVGTADGRVLAHDGAEYAYAGGEAHASLVAGFAAAPGGTVHSVGVDDKLRELEGTTYTPASLSTGAQPKGVAVAGDGTVLVAEVAAVEAVRSNQKVFELPTKFAPSAIAAMGDVVAVGGEDQKVRLYSWDGKVLKEEATLEGNKGPVSALAFTPDGQHLAAGDSTGKIVLFDAPKRSMVTGRWSFHTARINSLAWAPDGQHLASGSLDTHVYVWSVPKPMKNIALKNAGPGGVNSVWWMSTTGLASAGADGCVRTWEVTFH
ncbi:WD40 repeat-like protein [Epithele typhae]|uniref:WD40 repeat-like protein n=1 Tax=Epithele typhae TaxID=378194 RepID=UPI00200728BB|nr:WD40 repeat-like protein [Epithele typhae]KAH9941649.1 WD40 repeat-like protein [Epithele typhae]